VENKQKQKKTQLQVIISTEHLKPSTSPVVGAPKKNKKSKKHLAVTRDDIDFAMLLSNQKKPERISQQKKKNSQ